MKKWNRAFDAIVRFDERFVNTPLLVSVRRGLTYMIPVILLGSIALLVLSLPIPAYQRMMVYLFGEQWKDLFQFVRDGTFNILSLILVVCVSYAYVTQSGERSGYTNPIIVAVVSLGSFVAVFGITKEGFSIANYGVIGVFIAIVVSLTSTMLFLKLSTVQWLRIRAFTDGASASFNTALTALFPAAITITVYAVINQMLSAVFGISDIQDFLSDMLCRAFDNIRSPFVSGLIFIFLVHLFWFFGLHGSNILEPVAQKVLVPKLAANQQLLALGQAPDQIVTKTFLDSFVLMGGCGAILCLIFAILIAGRYKSQRRLMKLSAIPVLFNINELMVFGLPIVLNPVYVIPFLGVPVLLTVTSYLAMAWGLVPPTTSMVEWTTPIFLSGYASTGSLSGSLLQLVNLTLGTLCYIPFVKLAEAVADSQVRTNLERVYSLFRQGEERGMVNSLLTRHDDIGNIARFLAADLEHALKGGGIKIFYQPQADFEGNIIGVEALLRWKHESYGYIYPPLIIALAEEAKLMDRLSYRIMDTACADLNKMYALGFGDVTLSVNVSAVQLESERFLQDLEEIMERHRIREHSLQIEITEQVALAGSRRIIERVSLMKEMGVKLAMDDFGMGHSSLLYLKEYEFDTIKLDGSLVREIQSNANCCKIISSIVYLGRSSNYSVIAEYVEKDEQRLMLHELGCDMYQGYLYSPAIPYGELVAYILGRRSAARASLYCGSAT